ncbi:hypothetical protein D3C86_1590920 [compost metagenome]
MMEERQIAAPIDGKGQEPWAEGIGLAVSPNWTRRELANTRKGSSRGVTPLEAPDNSLPPGAPHFPGFLRIKRDLPHEGAQDLAIRLREPVAVGAGRQAVALDGNLASRDQERGLLVAEIEAGPVASHDHGQAACHRLGDRQGESLTSVRVNQSVTCRVETD